MYTCTFELVYTKTSSCSFNNVGYNYRFSGAKNTPTYRGRVFHVSKWAREVREVELGTVNDGLNEITRTSSGQSARALPRLVVAQQRAMVTPSGHSLSTCQRRHVDYHFRFQVFFGICHLYIFFQLLRLCSRFTYMYLVQQIYINVPRQQAQVCS